MVPKLIIKDNGYFVTDGIIDSSTFIVKKQPSKVTINFLYNLFWEDAIQK